MKFIIISILICNFAFANYKMECEEVRKGSFDIYGIHRCSNDEVICYFTEQKGVLSCFKK